MLHAPAAQLLAHNAGQGADGGLAEVGDLQPGGVQLVAGAQGADDGGPSGPALQDQIQLPGDSVDAVHHVVVGFEIELIPGLREVKGLVGVDLNIRVDVPDPGRGGLDLGLTQGAVQGEDLAVEIGAGHPVVVDEVQSPHAGPGQGLDDVAPHAPQPKDRHPGPPQPIKPLFTDQHLGSYKLVFHIFRSFF